jgi:serine/threonine protein kinase
MQTLTPGGWSKAALRRLDWAGGRAVLKDFAGKAAPVRLLGRLQIGREVRAYDRLRGIEGIPRFFGRVDPWAFLMEEIPGRHLPRYRLRAQGERAGLLAQLRGVLDAVHRAGVVHNDARGQDNVLVSDSGRVYLLDFAGAVCLAPGSRWHRWLFPRLVRADEQAFLKWKAILLPEEITSEESRSLRRYARWRRLWILNPKGWGRGPAVVRASERQERE